MQFLRSKGYSDEDAQALTQYPDFAMKIIGSTLSSQEGYRTLLKRLNRGDYEAVPTELQKWTKAGGKRLQGLVHRRVAEAGLWAKGAYVSSNYQTVETKQPTGFLKAEALAPIIGSFSGLGGFLAGNGPIQWALAAIMVLAACTGIFFVAKRFQEHRL